MTCWALQRAGSLAGWRATCSAEQPASGRSEQHTDLVQQRMHGCHCGLRRCAAVKRATCAGAAALRVCWRLLSGGDVHAATVDLALSGDGDVRLGDGADAGGTAEDERRRVVEACGDLRGVSAQLSGHERRRAGRHQGHHAAAELPEVAGYRRDLDHADVSLTPGGLRLRHCRLRGDRSAVWHDGRLRQPDEGGEAAGHPGHHGHGDEPYLGPEPVVPGVAVVEDQSQARLVYLARRQGRRAAEQLAVVVRPLGVDATIRRPSSTTTTTSMCSSRT